MRPTDYEHAWSARVSRSVWEIPGLHHTWRHSPVPATGVLYTIVNDVAAGLGSRMSEDPSGMTAVSSKTLAPDYARRFERALEVEMPLLLASARALLRNESDACDLAQTTLEIAVRRAGDLRALASLRPWLLAIQYREAFRARRRLGRLIGLSPAVSDTLVTGDANADLLALRGALPRLPPRARAAVVLHYLADLPVSEVARTMGISENTAKSNLRAGLARLREELGDG